MCTGKAIKVKVPDEWQHISPITSQRLAGASSARPPQGICVASVSAPSYGEMTKTQKWRRRAQLRQDQLTELQLQQETGEHVAETTEQQIGCWQADVDRRCAAPLDTHDYM